MEMELPCCSTNETVLEAENSRTFDGVTVSANSDEFWRFYDGLDMIEIALSAQNTNFSRWTKQNAVKLCCCDFQDVSLIWGSWRTSVSFVKNERGKDSSVDTKTKTH